jgi:hypothetical protein
MTRSTLTTRTTLQREHALTGSWCLQGMAYLDSQVSPIAKFANPEVGQ